MDRVLKVEVLEPPLFKRTGKVIDRTEAWQKGFWYGQFNIWVVKSSPEPFIIYQKRSPTIGWAPNKLDVAIGGHYEDGEDFDSAVRKEAAEELGIKFSSADFVHVGRKLSVNKGAFDNTKRNVVIDIYLLEDNRNIKDYRVWDKEEIYGLCELKVSDVLKLFEGKIEKIHTNFLRNDGKLVKHLITKDSFPENWDNYQEKMVKIIDKYFKKEKVLEY